MGDYWLRALEAAEAAEDAARRLRRRYGDDAETHLEDVERELAGEPRRPARLDDVRRALRWTRAP
jgi:hypothetical protein